MNILLVELGTKIQNLEFRMIGEYQPKIKITGSNLFTQSIWRKRENGDNQQFSVTNRPRYSSYNRDAPHRGNNEHLHNRVEHILEYLEMIAQCHHRRKKVAFSLVLVLCRLVETNRLGVGPWHYNMPLWSAFLIA